MALHLQGAFLFPCCDVSTHFQEHKAPDKQEASGLCSCVVASPSELSQRHREIRGRGRALGFSAV